MESSRLLKTNISGPASQRQPSQGATCSCSGLEWSFWVSSRVTNALSCCQLSNTNIILYNGALCAPLKDQQGCNHCLKGCKVSSVFARYFQEVFLWKKPCPRGAALLSTGRNTGAPCGTGGSWVCMRSHQEIPHNKAQPTQHKMQWGKKGGIIKGLLLLVLPDINFNVVESQRFPLSVVNQFVSWICFPFLQSASLPLLRACSGPSGSSPKGALRAGCCHLQSFPGHSCQAPSIKGTGWRKAGAASLK